MRRLGKPVLLGYVALFALGLFIVAVSLAAMFFGWRVAGGERPWP